MHVGLLAIVVLAALLVVASGVWVAVALLRAVVALNRRPPRAGAPTPDPEA
jgi:hypothetical protein